MPTSCLSHVFFLLALHTSILLVLTVLLLLLPLLLLLLLAATGAAAGAEGGSGSSGNGQRVDYHDCRRARSSSVPMPCLLPPSCFWVSCLYNSRKMRAQTLGYAASMPRPCVSRAAAGWCPESVQYFTLHVINYPPFPSSSSLLLLGSPFSQHRRRLEYVVDSLEEPLARSLERILVAEQRSTSTHLTMNPPPPPELEQQYDKVSLDFLDDKSCPFCRMMKASPCFHHFRRFHQVCSREGGKEGGREGGSE